MSDVFALQDALKEQEKEQYTDPALFEKEEELTEEEIERVNQMDNKHVILVDRDQSGRALNTTVDDYVSSLDHQIERGKIIEDDLKLINRADIKEENMINLLAGSDISSNMRQSVINAARVTSLRKGLSDDEIYRIITESLHKIQDTLQLSDDEFTSDFVDKHLSKRSPQEIFGCVTEEFLNLYTTEEDRKRNILEAKKKIIAAISYILMCGPEFDRLNQYIENENKLIVVSKRLLQCRIELSEALKDKKTMSELILESREYEPLDDSYWVKYIPIPNRVKNDFAQRVVIYKKYKESYQKILDEYEDIPENEKARALIQDEIKECDMKIDVYKNVTELTLFPELWENLVSIHHSAKKMSMKYIIQEATQAVDRVRRCKQDLPFPEFNTNTKKPEVILGSYIPNYAKMIMNYNETLDKAMEHEDVDGMDKKGIEPIRLEGFKEADVALVFSLLLTILMGKVVRKLTKGSHDKFDAITLDSYFQMFSKLGTDIYLMNKTWLMMKEHVHEIMDKYYVPAMYRTKGTH